MKNLITLLIAIVFIKNIAYSQTTTKLLVKNKITQTLQLKEQHSYSIRLKKGEFAQINILQKNIDLKITTFNPNGNQLEEFDSNNGSNGDELVLIDALHDGDFLLEITPLEENKKEKIGAYDIELLSINDNVKKHLSEVLNSLYQREFLPGLAVSVVNKDSILYKKAMGYASLEDRKPYTENTVQNIASISKTFIGLSLMMLVEEGKLSLDTEINNILPFKIANPYFPNIPITVRHLATHTSSINDFPIYYTKAGVIEDKSVLENKSYPKEVKNLVKKAVKNKDMTMQAFIEKMLTKKGDWYKKNNFFKTKPGEQWFYSNVGAAIAAYIVELVSKTPYDEFVIYKILKPYDLQSANWGHTNVDHTVLASNYATGNILLPVYKIITYPDGSIYINSNDLSTYLFNLMKGYFGDENLLKTSSYREMMKVQFEDPSGDYKGRKSGLFWEHSKTGNMGHNGGDTGVIAMMHFNPDTKVGYTLMCNMDPTENGNALAEFEKIWLTIKRYAHIL